MKGSKVNGSAPDFDSIANGKYPVSRPLFIYVKGEHVDQVKGIKELIKEFTNEEAWGDEGYLADKGLIPMPEAKRKEVTAAAAEMKALAGDELN